MRKLTEKQHAFTLKVFENKEPGPAYMEIYRVRSMAVASTCASKLLRVAKVQELLGELRKKVVDASVADVLEMEQILTAIMRGRFADFMTNLTPEKLKSPALQEIKVTERDGGKTTTIKLNDPVRAIDQLCKLMGLYKEVPGATVNIDNRSVNIGEGAGTDAKNKLIAELARYAARAEANRGDKEAK